MSRKAIYSMEDGTLAVGDNDASCAMNMFQQAGILVRKRQLPFRVFRDTASGFAAVSKNIWIGRTVS
jgi:hypothetical protein